MRLAIAVLLASLPLAATGAAEAQSVEQFYRGKQISFFIGFEPGETYDIYARLAAVAMARHMPGHPTFVPRNMSGIGGLKVANYLDAQAPRDGTAIGMSTQSLALEQALKNPAAQFDVRSFGWIGRMAPILQFIVATRAAPVKSFADAREHPVILSATSPSGMTYVIPQVLNRLAGARFKIIPGYNGTSGALLAIERGEVEGGTMTVANLLIDKPDWLKDGKISVLVSNADERYAAMPNVPSMVEVGRSEEERQILALYSSTAKLGRAIMAPPGIPTDRLAALREAFDALAGDAEFRTELAARKLIEFDPLSGAELQRSIAAVLDIPPAALARAAQAKEE